LRDYRRGFEIKLASSIALLLACRRSRRSEPTAAAAWCRRPDSNIATHQYGRYLRAANDDDVMECTHRSEHRRLRVERGYCSNQHRYYHAAFSGCPDLCRVSTCQQAVQLRRRRLTGPIRRIVRESDFIEVRSTRGGTFPSDARITNLYQDGRPRPSAE
jgi:hypothetical protein